MASRGAWECAAKADSGPRSSTDTVFQAPMRAAGRPPSGSGGSSRKSVYLISPLPEPDSNWLSQSPGPSAIPACAAGGPAREARMQDSANVAPMSLWLLLCYSNQALLLLLAPPLQYFQSRPETNVTRVLRQVRTKVQREFTRGPSCRWTRAAAVEGCCRRSNRATVPSTSAANRSGGPPRVTARCCHGAPLPLLSQTYSTRAEVAEHWPAKPVPGLPRSPFVLQEQLPRLQLPMVGPQQTYL